CSLPRLSLIFIRPPWPTLFPYTTLFRSSRTSRPQAEILRALVSLDQPQGYRHALPDLRDHGGHYRRPYVGRHPHGAAGARHPDRSEEHTSELQSRENLVCRLLLEKKNPA